MKTVLSQVARTSIATGVSKSLAGQRAMSKAVDVLHAEGITSEMLVAPKKDEDRTFYESVCGAVVLGFTQTVQDLLGKDTKSLNETQKADKRYWQQQIGSKVKDLRNMLARRESASEGGDGANEKSTLESRIKRDLAKYIAQLEKVESFKGNVVDLIADLKSAIARIK